MVPDDAGTVYQTSNGGHSWKLLTILQASTFTFHLFFSDKKNGWFFTSEELWGTGDGGETWAPKFKVNYADFGVVQDMFFINKNTGWLATGNGYVLKCAP